MRIMFCQFLVFSCLQLQEPGSFFPLAPWLDDNIEEAKFAVFSSSFDLLITELSHSPSVRLEHWPAQILRTRLKYVI